MDYLYACLFDNGHVKVGRSTDPDCRIKQHQDRVACFGVKLGRWHTARCIGSVALAEGALIALCASRAASRHLNEWFAGLDFSEVIDWVDDCAQGGSSAPNTGPTITCGPQWAAIIRALRGVGLTQSDLGAICKCDHSSISDLATGRLADPRYSVGKTLISLFNERCGA